MASLTSAYILKKEANDHLREIRRRKGVDDSGGQHSDNVGDLNRTLNILADQLYKKPTHFLLELIQNADDNSFDNDVPTISFYLSASGNSWQMRVDCNEVGFEKENIEALCRIGDSTKKASDRTKGYIGEKGIGFKSVFRVADVIHISSKAYAFKFDRRAILGMITPIIETFPSEHLIASPIRGPQTQMLLELQGESEFRNIKEELQKLDPEILIFLHKISKLVVHTPDEHFQIEILRAIEDRRLDRKETVTLTRTSLRNNVATNRKYMIVRHLETSLPREDRRPNVNETEIVLAFPIDQNMRPKSTWSQYTYAYLPVDDYGFNYLIQGDFLLVANRESVDSSKWNDSVLAGVFRAFVFKAVPRFNAFPGNSPLFGGLRYTWLLFLKDRGGTSEFWSTLKQWIFIRLPTENVLESRHISQLSRPDSLVYIPPEFRLDGEPLVEDENSELRHLSFLYDSEIHNILPELKRMDVKVMGFPAFFLELKSLISKPGGLFLQRQSNKWHSKVANLFCRHGSKTQVANIPLIPLRDGRWVTSSQSHLFLEEDTSDAIVPSGINICLVDAEACQDPNRKALFKWLGIKKCGQAEVCRMIMECYSPFRARSWPNSVHDLLYLFQTPLNVYNKPIDHLQLIPARPFEPNFMYAKKLYIEYPGSESIISKYSGDIAGNMPLLHSRYIEAVRELGKEHEFVTWACCRLKVSTTPRLVNEQQLLTPEFNFLKTTAPKDLLLLLRDHWDNYGSDIDSRNSRTSNLRLAISEMNVDCTDSLRRRLNTTVLPLVNLKIHGPNLSFIDIPDSDNPGWLKFSKFGVLTSLSTEFYLRQLKALAALPVTDSTSKLAVEILYRGLEWSTRLPSTIVPIEFEQHPLVFHHPLRRWVFLRDCVWSGPRLNSFHNLSSQYPQRKTLFRDYLSLENVSRRHVIKELQGATGSISFERLEELLLLLNKHLKLDSPQDCVFDLKGKKIIPVRKTDGNLHRLTYDQDNWYLADRQSLWDSFTGKLPLISFDVRTVQKLRSLINAMDLKMKLLSEADKQKLETVGGQIYDEAKTRDLRRRAHYFLPLITEETSEAKSQLLARLTALKVWGVPAIKLTHEVDGVKGTEEMGNVVFDDADDSKLEIYISFNDSQKAIVDFELSEAFIRYCGITDHGLQKLVAPILTYDPDHIERFLEGYGLDGLGDHLEGSADNPESVSGESDRENGENNSQLVRRNADLISSSRTPNSGNNVPYRESGLEVSRSSSFLRERIPTLGQSISSVSMTAALPSTAPTLVIAQSQTPINPTHLTQQTTHDAFELRDLHTTFSEVFETDTPPRSSPRPSNQRPYAPRSSHSPRIPRTVPDPESTQGIHLQKIGLLGEIFVNYWLSRHLENAWDPTRHWTSRNRNYIYSDCPFMGREKDYADFTYPDPSGHLTNILIRYGFIRNIEHWSTKPPTYHLEVKSTTETCNEPFYMSNNQVEMARGYSISWESDRIPENVYVVIRVYNLEKETNPGFTSYVDPWAMYLKRELSFLAREDYVVTLNAQDD